MNLTELKKMAAIALGCMFGMVIIQLAAPLILGILIQGAAFAVPLAVFHFFIKKGWRLRLDCGLDGENTETEGRNDEEKNEKVSDGENAGKGAAQRPDSSKKADGKADNPLPETERQTVSWYEEQGRERIFSVIHRLSGKGVCDCWIRKDGICSMLKDGGYRRAGMLPGYEEVSADAVIRLLRKDRIQAERRGRYLYLSWEIRQEELNDYMSV